MSTLTLIVLARAIHVLAGVAWVGAVFVLAVIVQPIGARHGAEGAARWTGMVAMRTLNWVAVTATLTVLSGIYLFAAVHGGDHSAGGIVLMVGAVAALLALVAGFGVGRPAAVKVSKLLAGPQSADAAARIAALRRRVVLAVRTAAGLLAVAAVAMAVFRYATAFV